MAIKAAPPPPVQQQDPYQPPGPQPLVFEKFQGIKTSTTRPGVPDEAMWWSDGFFPIGPRCLRTLPGLAAPIYGADGGRTIIFFGSFNIGSSPYHIVVLSDGSIISVNTISHVANVIAAVGTIQNPSRLNVGMSQYGSSAIIIVAKQTNGYFIWNGTTFYVPGAVFTDGEPLPTGLGGSSVEVYQGRVWVANGPVISFSAPGSLTLFDTGDGGGNFASSDPFLRVGFTQLLSSNGFLYLIADSSVNYISGVQTSGSPPTTTFTNQNADPEVGTPWPGTATVFGRNIVFANAFGVHVSYGAAVTKVSDDLDGVYATLPNFGGLLPSAAKAIVFGKKVWILLLPIVDPITGQQTNKLFLWNTKIWFATSQDVALQFVVAQEVNSVLTAWGCNGTQIFQLFQQPSNAFTKTVQSRFWDTPVGIQEIKATNRLWGMAQYYALDGEDFRISVDSESSISELAIEQGPTLLTWTNDNGDPLDWTNTNGVLTWTSIAGAVTVFPPTAIGQQGVLLGLTAQTEASDAALIMLSIQPEIVSGRY